MNIGIVGSRSFQDKKKAFLIFETYINKLLISQNTEHNIVSGGAKGADTLAELISLHFLGKKAIVFKPNWAKYGVPAAAFIRNDEIVKNSDLIVAFWDGVSSGTKDTINKAKKRKVNTLIFYI